MVFEFQSFELDDRLYELRRDGEIVKVTPRVFDLLAYLIRNRERVVPKEELLEQVWGRKFVSESSLPTCVNLARKAIDDSPDGQHVIQTVYGRGYRFVAHVIESEPSHASESLGADAANEPVPLRRLFVGRERELAALGAALSSTLAGHGRLVTLSGPAGIGKTRLAEELVGRAKARGARVLAGRCSDDEGARSFWPWVQVIRSYARDREPASVVWALGSSAAEIAEVVPEIRETIDDIPRLPKRDKEAARFRLFDGVARFLRRASKEEPLVLLLDDLHCADQPSLLLLEFLARDIGDARILIIGTHRDEARDRAHPLARALGELTREDLSHSIALEQLSNDEVAEFLKKTAGRDVPEDLVALVYAKTAGNALFLSEISRLLVSEGKLDHLDEVTSWSVTVPVGIREAIRRGLCQLSDASNRLLAIAAVSGREVELPVLEAASDLEHDALLHALQESLDARVLEETSPCRMREYRFSHPLVQEMIYEEIPIAQRAALHLRVGEAIETLGRADPERVVPDLARHYRLAGSAGCVEKAIDFEERAGKQAAQSRAYEDAAGHFERALELLATRESTREADDLRAGELLLELAEAQERCGDWQLARDTAQRAATAAREADSPQLLARAALRYPPRAAPGVLDDEPLHEDGRKLAEEALARLDPEPSSLQAALLSRLSLELYGRAPQKQYLQLNEKAEKMAREVEDTRVLGNVLLARHNLLLGPGTVRKRLPLACEALKLADEAGARELAMRGHQALLHDLLELADPVGVELELEAISQLEEELKLRWPQAFPAMRLLSRGRLEEAERMLRETWSQPGAAPNTIAPRICETQMFALLWQQGRLHELEAALRSFAARHDSVLSWRVALAHTYMEGGKEAEAREEFERFAANDFADVRKDATWFWTVMLLASLCERLRDTERASLLYEMMSPYDELSIVIPPAVVNIGPVAHYLGSLATTIGDFDGAQPHFERSIELCTRMGSLPALAYTQWQYSRMLALRGRRGDEKRASKLADQALATAREIGLKPVIDLALEVKNQ